MVEPQLETSNEAEAEGRLAAIDIGSNSVRLVVAQVLPGGTYRVLDDERENTRLSYGLCSTGKLSDVSIDATITALRNFLQIAGGQGADAIRAIATSAVREAKNGAAFCARVHEELGLPIEVISAREEGRLAFMSVARAFDVDQREVAIADIGGGSTEIVLASNGLIDEVYPTKLGAVRITEQCDLADIIDAARLESATQFIDRELKHYCKKLPFTPDMLYGTGGTFTALGGIMLASETVEKQTLWGYRVKRAKINHLLQDLAAMPLEKRKKVTGLSPQRADIIVGGLLVIDRVMRCLGVNVVQIHTRGVRDGMLLDMIQSSRSRSVTSSEKRTAVEKFALNCGVDLEHSQQVARIASRLYEELAGPLGFATNDREQLELAAILANVGYLINFDKHHKHSFHLIMNSELPGFERHELQLVALVARYHRGTHPKNKHEGYRDLTVEDRERVGRLAAILRLALALDRTHQQQVEDIKCEVTPLQVVIEVAAKENADVDIWAARRKVDLFERVFRRQVIIASR